MKITESKQVTSCLITGTSVTKVLDLGQHPYADTFIADHQLHLSEPVFPLEVYMAPESGHLQLGYMSNAQDRYNLYAYSYTSSNSLYSRNHWVEFANTVKEKFNPTGLVVEIGSNDGYLIKQFQSERTRALGIDSSEEMCAIATSQGVESLNAVFNHYTAANVIAEYGRAQVVIANNVFNHANDPVDFAEAVADLLELNGRFIFEVPYWLAMTESGRFVDMVYHEHPSYFTVKSVLTLLNCVGLTIESVDVVEYHGGSLRVVACHAAGQPIPDNVQSMIDREHAAGLFTQEFYKKLEAKFLADRAIWLAKFYELKMAEPNAVIIGVGAAAKANTWLTWHGLSHRDIAFVTDSSEFKQNKFTPLSRIPIRSDEEFANHSRPWALILSWNISEGLKNAILKINPNVRFLSQ